METYHKLTFLLGVIFTLQAVLVLGKGIKRNDDFRREEQEQEQFDGLHFDDYNIGRVDADTSIFDLPRNKVKSWKQSCKDIKKNNVCMTPGCVMVAGNVLKNMGLDQDPCENFYKYACKGFIEDPPENFGIFPQSAATYQRNEILLRRAIKKDSSTLLHGQESEALSKMKQVYDACLSSNDSTGLTPVFDLINDLGSWTISSNEELTPWSEENSISVEESLARAHLAGSKAFFDCKVMPDYNDGSKNRIKCDQNHRGNFLGIYASIRSIIIDTVKAMGETLDSSDQEAMGEAIADLDDKIFKAFIPFTARTSIPAIYNKLTVQELTDLMGGSLDMAMHFSKYVGQEVKPTDEVLIYAKDYFERLGAILKNVPKKVVQNYIVMSAIMSHFDTLPAPLHVVRDVFANGIGLDVTHNAVKCTSTAAAYLPFATTAMFVQDQFTEDDRVKFETLTRMIKQAFQKSLLKLEWIDQATKKAALIKTEMLLAKLAYPEWIMDVSKLDEYYADLDISGNQFSNVINSDRHASSNNVKLFGTPVDRNKWKAGLYPTVASAVYAHSTNEMVLQQGIFHEVFYGDAYPKALIFGMIGTIIGHEFIHAFDLTGRLRNGTGQLDDWWQPDSAAAYQEKAQCFIDQYDKITTPVGQVRGAATLNENIADNGGLNIAYDAYKEWQQNGGKDESLPGLGMSPDQLFFLGYTQSKCTYVLDRLLGLVVFIDIHAPSDARGEYPLMNTKNFAEAFKCPVGSRMNPEKKCSMWG